MIKHIVCFKLKNDSIELRNKTRDILLSMKGRVPMLLDLEVGIDFLSSQRSYDIILETYFNNKEDLEKYQNDPAQPLALGPCERRALSAGTVRGRGVDFGH